MKSKVLIATFAILILSLLSAQSVCAQQKSIDIKSLVNLMEGSFSSEEQSMNDPDYFDIRLEMKRIWKNLTTEEEENKNAVDEYWIYVEQASAEALVKPYRQRVYRITRTYEGRFESTVFTFNDPLRFAGDWKLDEPLAALTPDSLIQKEGCTVTITMMGKDHYEGGTPGKGCESELSGAKYATSEVEIFADRIISWDRGFDENDVQVWGAEKGGYVFKRIKN